MRNSKRCPSIQIAFVAGLLAFVAPSMTVAQSPVDGFAVGRLGASAPGSVWLLGNDLQRPPGLSGEAAFTLGYARRPLRATGLDVVDHQAFMEVALGLTWGRWRVAVILPSPLFLSGESGPVGSRMYSAPDVTLSHTPDAIADPRFVVEGVLAGATDGPFRLGAEATLIAPSGRRRDYLSDGTFRGAAKALCAGTVDRIVYAASLGIHLRPLDGESAGGPRGHELLFGTAVGMKVIERAAGTLVLGPEVVGASAFKVFGEKEGTALEALLGASLQKPMGETMRLFAKLGAGAGVVHSLGAPEWRILATIGVASTRSDRQGR